MRGCFCSIIFSVHYVTGVLTFTNVAVSNLASKAMKAPM